MKPSWKEINEDLNNATLKTIEAIQRVKQRCVMSNQTLLELDIMEQNLTASITNFEVHNVKHNQLH